MPNTMERTSVSVSTVESNESEPSRSMNDASLADVVTRQRSRSKMSCGIDRFKPHPLLRSGHLQTVLGALAKGALPPYRAIDRKVPLADGEALVIHEEQTPQLIHENSLALLVHGLGGDHSSPYMRRIATRLAQAGYRVWRMDLCGCGAGMQHSHRPAHAGTSGDLAAVLAYAQKVYPQAQIAVAAFSLGGNILLKMLGELVEGELSIDIDRSRIAKAIAVAPPADLHTCSMNMERLTRRPYTNYYLKMLGKQVKARADRWDAWKAISPNERLKTIRQFDRWYTVPLGGFKNTDDYYSAASSKRWLNKIDVPTHLLLDRDDPIIPFRSFQNVEFSPSIECEVTRFGGHLGYLARARGGGLRRWMDDWTEQMFHHVFQQ